MRSEQIDLSIAARTRKGALRVHAPPASTRKRSRTAARPSRVLSRVRRSPFRYCSSCIHSVPSTSTSSTPRRSRRGRACRAMVGPTTSLHSVQIGKLASSEPAGKRAKAARSASPSVVTSRATDRSLYRSGRRLQAGDGSMTVWLTAQDIVLYPLRCLSETQYLGAREGGDDAHGAAAGAGTWGGGGGGDVPSGARRGRRAASHPALRARRCEPV